MTVTLASAEDLDASATFFLHHNCAYKLDYPPCPELALLPLQAKHAGSEYTYCANPTSHSQTS